MNKRTERIIGRIRKDKDDHLQRTAKQNENYDDSLKPHQIATKETASMLNANGYEFDRGTQTAKFRIWGRPSVHQSLIRALIDIALEQGSWSDPSVYHPVHRVYGAPNVTIEHEIVLTFRYNPINPG